MLAPMAGVTTKTFRRMAEKHGAPYSVTEMISAKALCYEQLSKKGAVKTATLAEIEVGAAPTAVQIFGSEPDFMAKAATMLENLDYNGAVGEKPVAIDINMGCPVKKVVSCGEGSALMKTPELAERIVEAVVRAVKIPVTVKIRTGWDESTKNAPDLARRLEAAGASAICVHGRTRMKFYSPPVDLDTIAEVKKAVKIPVFGNGGVYSAKDALEMFGKTGCDGVAVARGSLGNPWVFEEIQAALNGKEFAPPTREERIKTALDFLDGIIEERGERRGVAQARGLVSYFVHDIPGSAAARAAMNEATSREEFEKILENVL